MRIKFKAIALAGLFGISTSSMGAIIFQDDFNSENGGVTSVLDYDSFANWNVTSQGTVDLVKNGQYSTSGDGMYVDLDGSTNNAGRIRTKSKFSFSSGVSYRLSFDLAGNMRNNDTDSARSIVTTIDGPDGEPNYLSELISMAAGDGWTTYSFVFDGADIDGRIVFRGDVGQNQDDNIGLLLDNVVLESIEVSEPGTLALISLGILGLGYSRRRMAS